MPAPGVRLAIRASIAGFQLTLPLGTLRVHAGHAALHDDGLNRRASAQRTAQQSGLRTGKSSPHQLQPNSASDSHRAPTRLASLRRRLEAASIGAVVVSGGLGRESAATVTAAAPALETGRVLDSLKLTAEEPDDSFLLRWLRSRGHDVEEAEAAVRTHASWRAQCVPVGGISEVCAVCIVRGAPSSMHFIAHAAAA